MYSNSVLLEQPVITELVWMLVIVNEKLEQSKNNRDRKIEQK